jgi:hypothetical protein
MSQWEHDSITTNHLYLLLRKGRVIMRDNGDGYHSYRRATDKEVARHTATVRSMVGALRKSITTNFKYRSTLMKAAQIDKEADFDIAMRVLRKAGNVTSESSHGERGDKYRYRTAAEMAWITPAIKERQEKERKHANEQRRADEENRWREVAVQDALEIGLARFKKFRSVFPVDFNKTTEKWEYAPTGIGSFEFDIEIGREIHIDFGDVEVTLTSLYGFLDILTAVKEYRIALQKMESVCKVAKRARGIFRRPDKELKGEATFLLKVQERGVMTAGGWIITGRDAA